MNRLIQFLLFVVQVCAFPPTFLTGKVTSPEPEPALTGSTLTGTGSYLVAVITLC